MAEAIRQSGSATTAASYQRPVSYLRDIWVVISVNVIHIAALDIHYALLLTIIVWPCSQLLFLDSRLATAPLLVIVLFLPLKQHIPSWIRSLPTTQRLIRPYITFPIIQEAETRLCPNSRANKTDYNSITRKRSWRTVVLGVLALFEALGWCSVVIYTYSTVPRTDPYSIYANYWWNSVVMSVA
jgi:hypothetical protein